jgi:hypothetical protein
MDSARINRVRPPLRNDYLSVETWKNTVFRRFVPFVGILMLGMMFRVVEPANEVLADGFAIFSSNRYGAGGRILIGPDAAGIDAFTEVRAVMGPRERVA